MSLEFHDASLVRFHKFQVPDWGAEPPKKNLACFECSNPPETGSNLQYLVSQNTLDLVMMHHKFGHDVSLNSFFFGIKNDMS
jgi:hypothetical protein